MTAWAQRSKMEPSNQADDISPKKDGRVESTFDPSKPVPLPPPKKRSHLRRKWKWYILPGLVLTLVVLSLPEYFHTNQGTSESIGSVRDGKLKNGWLLPWRADNVRYFSWFSYFIFDNAYVDSVVYHTVMDAYRQCQTTCPDHTFTLMECSDQHGGHMLFHWTHQNGTSVDFMVPKRNGAKTDVLSCRIGMPHYLLNFNSSGQLRWNKNTEIDFEVMARHLLALDDAAKKHGISIRKILFHTDLHDELFSTPAGKELQLRELRIVPRLDKLVNQFHDDHYHVDFRLEPRE